MKDFRTRAKEIEKEYNDLLKAAIDKEYKEVYVVEAKRRAENLMMLKDGYKPKQDSIVESVIKQFKKRSEVGIAKYGVTLDRTDLSTLDWINHAQQEAMDFCLYLEKLKQQFTDSDFGLKDVSKLDSTLVIPKKRKTGSEFGLKEIKEKW